MTAHHFGPNVLLGRICLANTAVFLNQFRVCWFQNQISQVHRLRGEASFARGEVISAKETANDVRTSITDGTRDSSAACNAGAICAGSSTRCPAQPMARAIAA